jgi:hypothetical protein
LSSPTGIVVAGVPTSPPPPPPPSGVPAPSSVLLLMTGLAGCAAWQWANRRRLRNG